MARGQYNRSLLDNAAFRLTFALLKSCQQQEEGGRRSRRREGTRGRKGWSYNRNSDRWVSSSGWEPKQKEAGEAISKGLLQINSEHCCTWWICIVQESTFTARNSWGFWSVFYHQMIQKANRRVLQWSHRWWFSSYSIGCLDRNIWKEIIFSVVASDDWVIIILATDKQLHNINTLLT